MKIYTKKNLSNFVFWGGAVGRADLLTEEEFDYIEAILGETCDKESWSETEINDLFWFDFDWIAEMLGYENEDDMFERRK